MPRKQWTAGALSPRVNRQRRQDDHSPPLTVQEYIQLNMHSQYWSTATAMSTFDGSAWVIFLAAKVRLCAIWEGRIIHRMYKYLWLQLLRKIERDIIILNSTNVQLFLNNTAALSWNKSELQKKTTCVCFLIRNKKELQVIWDWS